MNVEIGGKSVATDEQGFLCNLGDWSEGFAEKMAELDGIKLYDEHWGLIGYFRDYFEETHAVPSMRKIVLSLGRQLGEKYSDRKQYEKHLYELFHRDPIREICKLAGLPKPTPDS